MSDIRELQKALVKRVLEGAGKAPCSDRRAAFDNRGSAERPNALVNKVASHSHLVTDEDINAARGSGLSEDQIFELVVCAAIGQATRQYVVAFAALETVTGKE